MRRDLPERQTLAEENIRRRAQHIGYVMQNPNQMISKTMIYDEVALGLQRSGLTEAQIREKVEQTLKVCGLYPFRNWPVSALSFGQKKRVTIASVLVLDPELILLDEPTAGQDFRHYTDIMEFLRGLNAQGVTVVMITHDMHLMLEYTQRALVFCDGRTHRRPQPGGRSVRPRADRAGGTEGDQPLHAGQPLRHCARAGICGALHRAGPGGAGTWPLKLF